MQTALTSIIQLFNEAGALIQSWVDENKNPSQELAARLRTVPDFQPQVSVVTSDTSGIEGQFRALAKVIDATQQAEVLLRYTGPLRYLVRSAIVDCVAVARLGAACWQRGSAA